MDCLEGDDDRLYIKSWNFWKASDRFFWRHNFRAVFFFVVSFLDTSFSLLFSTTGLHRPTLEAVNYITKLKPGFFLVVTSFFNPNFFCCSIVIYSLFISWIGMMVQFLAAPYASDQRTMLLDDCCLHFSRRKATVSSVLVSCNSIGATVLRDISFIYSDLASGDTCTKAAYTWEFGIKSGVIRVSSFGLKNMSLMTFLADTLKASHAFTNMEFMWWGNIFVVPYFSIHTMGQK